MRKHNETLDVFMIWISASLYKYLVIETHTKYCTVKSVVTYSISFGINKKIGQDCKSGINFYFISFNKKLT